jgi:vacuolar protein sorting-associated protein 13A/C
MNYFTRKLKFKVDRATLKFSKYETSNVKGPPDQLIQLLIAVYSQRMKYKVVSMLSAVSFDDWKNLAARDSGNDEFQDGDLLRVTGNLAGGTAGYFAKQVGGGIGTGIHTVTRVLGKEIEDATDKVGARAVGAGVNCVVTGLGAGVGDTVTGGKGSCICSFSCMFYPESRLTCVHLSMASVGSGTGKLLQGAGKGVGQVFGGGT